MEDRELLEHIDACRAGSRDVLDLTLPGGPFADLATQLAADPRAAQLYARVQAVDGRVRAALADVPVPEQLQARLLARLAASTSAATQVDDGPVTLSLNTVQAALKRAQIQRRARRRQLLAGTATAAAGLVIAALVWPRAQPFDQQAFDDAVRSFFVAEAIVPGSERLLSRDSAPVELPLPRWVLAATGPHSTWRPVTGLLGRRGVAYRLITEDGQEATLYVIRTAGSRNGPRIEPVLPGQPPARAMFTAGLATAYWREAGVAYMLVIRGSEREYRRFVRPAGAVA